MLEMYKIFQTNFLRSIRGVYALKDLLESKMEQIVEDFWKEQPGDSFVSLFYIKTEHITEIEH